MRYRGFEHIFRDLAYVHVGETNIRFLMIEGPTHAYNYLRAIPKDVALLCMNDDVKYQHAVTDKAIRDWQRHRWSRPADWER